MTEDELRARLLLAGFSFMDNFKALLYRSNLAYIHIIPSQYEVALYDEYMNRKGHAFKNPQEIWDFICEQKNLNSS